MISDFKGIKLVLCVDPKGCLKQLKAEGHALGKSDENIPCALVSGYLRSTARLLEARKFVVRGVTSGPGDFQFVLLEYEDSQAQYIKGVTDLLLKGLWDVQDDYPGQIMITIENEDSGGR